MLAGCQSLWQRYHIPAIALLVMALSGAVAEYVARLEWETAQSRLRSKVADEADSLRARLESELNSTVHLATGLAVFVGAQPDLHAPDFDRLAAQLLARGRHVRNIGLARDNVITHIYPVAGNQSALGLRYLDNPSQRGAVLRMMQGGEAVLAGPVNLVQGGKGLINRMPIYYPGSGGSDGRGRYWGLASIVLDFDSLLEAAGITTQRRGLVYALRGTDGRGAAGEVFFGDASLFKEDATVLEVAVPGGSWQLAARPVAGWLGGAGHGNLGFYRLIGLGLAILLGTLVFGWMREHARIQELALYDPLTGLPNRRLAMDQLRVTLKQAARRGTGCTLMCIDLDDFKLANDTFGHKAGDIVLKQIAQRVRGLLREFDTFARIGGDEFLLILPDMASHEEVRRVADRVIGAASAPIHFDNAEIRVGASAGYASFPQHGTTADELWVAADHAMYGVKKAGKGEAGTPAASGALEPSA